MSYRFSQVLSRTFSNYYSYLTGAKPEAEAEDVPSFITGADAIKQSGIPPQICADLILRSLTTPISIRGTDSKDEPNQRFGEKFDPKPTAIHQKSSNLPPCRGHIAADEYFTRIKDGHSRGFDLTDHSYGKFPEGSTHAGADSLATFAGADLGVEQRYIDGRLCIKRVVPEFKKIKEEDRADYEARGFKVKDYHGKVYVEKEGAYAEKFYIQETDSIRDIIKYVEKGQYEIVGIDSNGILTYKYPEGLNLEFDGVFKIDLKTLSNPLPEGEKWVGNPKDPIPEGSIPTELIKWASDDGIDISEMFDKRAAIIQEHPDGKVEPVLVQAGNSGYPVTGDFDLMHIGIPHDMPKIGMQAHNTYVGGDKSYTEGLIAFMREVKVLRDLITQSPEEKANNPILKAALVEGKISYSEFKRDYTADPSFDCFSTLRASTEKDPLDDFLTAEWIGSQGKMHLSAYLINCAQNLDMGKNMFQHGEESFNPGESEDFGALDHFYKGQVFHTDTEEQCLDFFFHDKDYLTTQFINVHPSCLRPNRPKTEDHIAKAWIDLIKIEILNGRAHLIKPNTIQAYDTLVAERPEFGSNFDSLVDKYEAIILDTDSSRWQNEVSSIYSRHSSNMSSIYRPDFTKIASNSRSQSVSLDLSQLHAEVAIDSHSSIYTQPEGKTIDDELAQITALPSSEPLIDDAAIDTEGLGTSRESEYSSDLEASSQKRSYSQSEAIVLDNVSPTSPTPPSNDEPDPKRPKLK